MNKSEFQRHVLQRGHELYRDMPWRHDTRPYYVLVSELMLQQTQVDRVIPKFNAFITAFPDERALASASLSDVLKLWNGLGYNRRAKFLHEAARAIIHNFHGDMPRTREQLMSLPGVGPNTAGAIMAYAFNEPVVFIETNIRTVCFHHYFTDGDKVSDGVLATIIEQTIDQDHPREFYWALMDYGSWLKKQGVGRVSQSVHYKKQAPLSGSVREVRGRIIKQLAKHDLTEIDLRSELAADERFPVALRGLLDDGLVSQTNMKLHLTR